MWTLNPDANIDGTGLIQEADFAPAFLVEQFGLPLPGDGCRMIGRYVFLNEANELFTVYDYKSTSAYLDDEDALSPEDYWRSEMEQEMSVGGRGEYGDGSAAHFVAWLRRLQADWQERQL